MTNLEKRRARERTPKYRAKQNARRRSPKYKAVAKARRDRPEIKAREKRLGRNRWLLRKYGITLEQYEKFHVKQKGLCAICRQPELTNHSLAMDHNHKNKKPRGLLCRKCNVALGLFRDDPKIVERAKAYLQHHE